MIKWIINMDTTFVFFGGMRMDEIVIPVDHKIAMTIREASAYSSIGINKIDSLLREPNCPFVLYVGTRKLVKRKEFEEFISQKVVI